jgi:hypothetical protein
MGWARATGKRVADVEEDVGAVAVRLVVLDDIQMNLSFRDHRGHVRQRKG